MFDPVDPKQSLPDLEEGILHYWQEEDTFKRSIRSRAENSGNLEYDGESGPSSELGMTGNRESEFSFYDGPPFATGLPHYGHLLAGTIKDVIPRYQTMRGKSVERRFGWDCHGLPIENIIERENEIEGPTAIEAFGVGKFCNLCRSAVQRYTKDWRTTVERMGRWVDMDWDYRTMDADYMESMWWAFKQLHRKNLIYEGHKSMHICPRCVTPLSNFEVTQGYIDRTDLSVVMSFPLLDDPTTVLLAWTTTPWSLPGNLWLLLSPDITYVRVRKTGDDRTYVLAEKLVETMLKNEEHEILGEVDVHELVGKRYEPLFPYFVDTVIPSTKELSPQTYGERCFTVMLDEMGEVSDAEGTGIVHITNSHGDDGFQISQNLGIDVLHHLHMNGDFIAEVSDFAGLNAKPEGDDPMATDKAVIANLKERGRHFSSYTYDHSYPHCWRCDSPLLNYATSSWFVDIQSIKNDMLKEKEKTHWVPKHLKDGRFGKWLEGARDWAISRNRYWGTPLPIWRQTNPNGHPSSTLGMTQNDASLEVIGSRDDLMARKQMQFTKVSVVRHGESEGNLIPIYQGEVPGTDLTENGIQQAAAAGTWLAGAGAGHRPVDVVYCSPLSRTKQTAQAIAAATGARVVVDERLKELSFGQYEGKTIDFSDLAFQKARRAHKFQTGQVESIYHFAGMETWESVQERVQSFFADILPLHRSEHICIVTHADVVMNTRHFFTGQDPMQLSHQPYPQLARPEQYYWDHNSASAMDLHKDHMDTIRWMGPKSEESVQLSVVRHGQTDWNAEQRLQGQNDTPLNDTGREQIKELAETLKADDYDLILTSDLARAVESGEIIAEIIGLPIEQLELLRERSFGEWDGKIRDELLEAHPLPYEAGGFGMHPIAPKNGEDLTAFLARTEELCQYLLTHYAGKRVLIVANGALIKSLHVVTRNLSFQEGISMRFKNGELSKITLNPFMERIPDVLDCWFESGSMPYAQSHFPFEFEHKIGTLPPGFPADFIAEGVDQCRAWFYTLMALSVAIFGSTPYKNVVVNGIVLAENGKKMSKRLKNYPEPSEIVNKYGADAIRWTLMSSPAVRAEDLRISEQLIEDSLRSVMLPLWNSYSFFVTYANAARFTPTSTHASSSHPLDQWISTEIQDLCNRMTAQLDSYDLSACCSELYESIDALTNWYIRLSRRRFAGKTNPQDQANALHTLYNVLCKLSQLLAPFCPFITEAIYLNLVAEEHGSVHLTQWPERKELNDEEKALLSNTRLMRQVVSLGNSVRRSATIKTRQPLQSASIAVPPSLLDLTSLSEEDHALLKEELNVKELTLLDDPGELGQAIVQVDARKVGPRLGKKVQELIIAGKNGDFTAHDDGTITIGDETLSSNECSVVYQGKEGHDTAADKGIVVAVETSLSEQLVREGKARDLIRLVQRLRKEQGLEFTDQITLSVTGADALLREHQEMIYSETNAICGENSGTDHREKIGESEVVVRFEKRT